MKIWQMTQLHTRLVGLAVDGAARRPRSYRPYAIATMPSRDRRPRARVSDRRVLAEAAYNWLADLGLDGASPRWERIDHMATRPRLFVEIIAAACLAVSGRGAFASWAFDGTASTRLDYGDLPVVTLGKTGAFSCFCTVRLDTVDGNDQFFFGKLSTGDKGWKLGLLGQADGGGDANRLAFGVGTSLLGRAERYFATEAVAGDWYTVGGSYEWSGAAGDIALYVDGVDDSAPSAFNDYGAPFEHADPLTVGGDMNGVAGNANGKIGHVAVWDGVALTAAEHALLAAGADPRTIRPGDLAFYARLEEPDAADLVTDAVPAPGPGAAFDTDRWPGSRPFIVGLGDPTPNSIRVLSHAGRAVQHVIEYSLDGSFSNQTPILTANVALDFAVVHKLTGLASDSVYNYRVLVDGEVVFGSESTFRTAPISDETTFRFVYSACTQFDVHSLEEGYPRYSQDAFRGIDARAPDFAVHSGDVYYADRGGSDSITPFNAWQLNTVEAYVRKVTEMLSERDFAAFTKKYPIYTMADDHEFKNNADITDRSPDPASPWQTALARVNNWFTRKNPDLPPEAIDEKGLWYTFSYGGVDFFFLDMRTQRGVNGSPGAGSMLGNNVGFQNNQLADLISWLDSSSAPFKVILAGGPLSTYASSSSDSWGTAFPTDQQNVFDALTEYRDVVYFAADVHWSGVGRLAAGGDGNPAHDFYEFLGGIYGGRVTTSAPDAEGDLLYVYDGDLVDPVRGSYLVVDVDTTACPASMTVSIVSHDPVGGAETVEYTHPPILSRVTCLADVDGDCAIGIVDLLALLAAWGTDPQGAPDLDGDGDVGINDFLAMLALWGPCV